MAVAKCRGRFSQPRRARALSLSLSLLNPLPHKSASQHEADFCVPSLSFFKTFFYLSDWRHTQRRPSAQRVPPDQYGADAQRQLEFARSDVGERPRRRHDGVLFVRRRRQVQ